MATPPPRRPNPRLDDLQLRASRNNPSTRLNETPDDFIWSHPTTRRMLRECEDCRRWISRSARTCPHCGRNRRSYVGAWVFWAVFVALLALATCGRAFAQEVGTPAVCTSVAGCSQRPDLLPDVLAAADETGVDPQDLLGAVNTTGLDARTYLCFADGLLCPAARSYTASVRLTHYTLVGWTYSGVRTVLGGTACSWNWTLGTRFVLPDGETFTCNDRGRLGISGWLDVWNRADLVRRYGSYVQVRVFPA